MLQKFIELCVKRRLAVLGLTLGIATYGVHAYLNTPVEAFPDVTNLQVNIVTQLAGLAPPEVEKQITIPIERALNGTPGMISMRSDSMFGLSLILLTFEDGTDPFRSRVLVEQRLHQAELPDGVTPELAPDATPLGEVYIYRLTSDRHTLTELRSEQEWNVAPMLKRVPGVADVVVRGGFLKEYHVEADPSRLLAHGLTLSDVNDALERANRNSGGGFMDSGDQQLVIRGVGYFQNAREIESVVLKSEGGVPVTIADVGRVVQSHTPRQGTAGFNDNPESVEGLVLMRRGENPSIVLEGLHEKLALLNHGLLPDGMRIETFLDRTLLVDRTLETVHHSLLEGAVLCIAIVYIFLRSLRGSLIVGSVIPLALLTAFIGLYAIGLPANLISMGAIDFGIIVDGAVILVENVIHKLQEHPPRNTRERLSLITSAAVSVAQPTLFAMAIIIAAMIPIFTLQRVEGRIFRPLALTYSFALIGALLFSLAFVPALCGLLMRIKDAQTKEPAFIEKLRNKYRSILVWLLRKRAVVIGAVLTLLALGGLVGSQLGSEFLPELDEGDILLFVEMPSSIALPKAQKILQEMRRRIRQFPEVISVDTRHGRPEDGLDSLTVNMADNVVHLKPRDQWRAGWDKGRLTEAIRSALEDIPGVRFNFSQPIKDSVEEAISGVRGKIVLKIFGPDLRVMRETLLHAMDSIRRVRGVTDLALYRDRSVPQLEIAVNRPALAIHGVDVATVQTTISTALAGHVVTELWEEERVVPVRLRLPQSEREDLDRIGEIMVPTPQGARVPLRELTHIALTPGRTSISRENNSRALALKFNVEGRDLGSVVADAIAAVHRDVAPHMADGYHISWTGEFENQQRAMKRLSIVVPLAIMVVFVLLYMALGSARTAGTVLLAAPFAMCGGIFALALTHINVSVSAAIGFIALLGQVSLAALLVLGAIDDRRRAGDDIMTAVVSGSTERFRAIIMTALLAMLGLMPMAVSTAVGSETQKPFAVVIIGGMVTTLFVTLFAVPVIYTFVAAKKFKNLESFDDEDPPSPAASGVSAEG
ncbi:MAG: efflux RND transporter permease subunit [Sandaracinaceae bacterium]|nr:efflux RND transporter permease subunit [Sandaracinaceae bacterium]